MINIIDLDNSKFILILCVFRFILCGEVSFPFGIDWTPPQERESFSRKKIKFCLSKILKIDFFSIENANISQFFLLDKLVSGQKVYNAKKHFLDCYFSIEK
jgi:hypothetical protein